MTPRQRLLRAGIAAFLPVPALAMQMARLEICQSKQLRGLAFSEVKRLYSRTLPRGDIRDRGGRVLARSLPAWACFADKRMIADGRAFSRRVAGALGRRPESILKRLHAARGPIAPLVEDLSYDDVRSLKTLSLSGLGFIDHPRRVYPDGTLAAGVLGKVSSEGRGLSGIELSEDATLSPPRERFEALRDGSGRLIYSRVDAPAPAKSVTLTIDRAVQFYVEEALKDAAARYRPSRALAAVQDPRNGEILAMAAWPPNPLKNSLVQDVYEPGSVFKSVAALAELRQPGFNPGAPIFCENGSYEIFPKVWIHDHEPSGNLDLAGILDRSSNIGISKLALGLGSLPFYRQARELGFSSRSGIGLPGEASGELPAPAKMSAIALASASYGYGVQATALQVLNAYSAIANGGTLWQPKIVKDNQTPLAVRQVAPADAVRKLSRMLENVVDNGTGEGARLPGYRVAGKTGTAHRIDPRTKKYSANDYNSTFVGYLPASSPRWTILVTLEKPRRGYYASEVCVPVFARIAKRLAALEGITPDNPSETTRASAPTGAIAWR